MHRRGRAAFFAALVLLVSSLPLAPTLKASTKADAVPDHVAGRALIGAKPGGKAPARGAIESSGGEALKHNSDGNFFIVKTPTAAPEWARRCGATPRYAELDYILRADTHEHAAMPNNRSSRTARCTASPRSARSPRGTRLPGPRIRTARTSWWASSRPGSTTRTTISSEHVAPPEHRSVRARLP